jgi:hypothetical protein
MEPTFFLPVGRQIHVVTTDDGTYQGELLGIISLAGIPAVWLRDVRSATTYDYILPMIQISAIRVEKEADKLILSGNMRTIPIDRNDGNNE